MEGSEEYLSALIGVLKAFALASGLKINCDKSMASWIGSKRNSNEKLCPHIPLRWSKEPFKILGITFTTNLKDMVDLNFEKRKQGNYAFCGKKDS